MYSFRPELQPAELDALAEALDRLLDDAQTELGSAYGSAWRQAALEEGVSAFEDDQAE